MTQDDRVSVKHEFTQVSLRLTGGQVGAGIIPYKRKKKEKDAYCQGVLQHLLHL